MEKCGIHTNDGRSYEKVVEGVPNLSKDDRWGRKKTRAGVAYFDEESRKEFEKTNIQRLVWRVVEEIFHTTNVEKIRRKLGIWIEEAINDSHGEVIFNDEPRGCRVQGEEQQREGEAEKARVFLEEDLILPMLHKDLDKSCPLIGAFEPSLQFEQSGAEVGPVEKCVEEDKLPTGLGVVVQSLIASCSGSLILGLEESVYSSPEFPPRFENFWNMDRPTNQEQMAMGEVGNFESCWDQILRRWGRIMFRVLGNLLVQVRRCPKHLCLNPFQTSRETLMMIRFLLKRN